VNIAQASPFKIAHAAGRSHPRTRLSAAADEQNLSKAADRSVNEVTHYAIPIRHFSNNGFSPFAVPGRADK